MAAVHKCENLWLTWDELSYLSDVADALATDRKKLLFGCACIRLGWEQLKIAEARVLVGVVEAFADHEVNREKVKAARRNLERAIGEAEIRVAKEVWLTTSTPPWYTAPDDAAEWTELGVMHHPEVRAERLLSQFNWITGRLQGASLYQLAWPALGAETDSSRVGSPARCSILRDLFGNPFRPVVFDPDWRTDTAVSLARQMYEAREFSAMPILADALQDAGCENADVLDHCRGDGPHVRGYWVVDLVLGKS